MCNNEEWQRRKKLPLWILGMNYKKLLSAAPIAEAAPYLYINTTSQTTIAEFLLHVLFLYRQQQDNYRECL